MARMKRAMTQEFAVRPYAAAALCRLRIHCITITISADDQAQRLPCR